jgi:hypothetical protein
MPSLCAKCKTYINVAINWYFSFILAEHYAFLGSFHIRGSVGGGMDEEGKQLLKQLSAIMQQIEQKGLLKEIDVEPTEQLPPASKTKNEEDQTHEKPVWKSLYKSKPSRGTKHIAKDFKLVQDGNTVYLEITRTKATSSFFENLFLGHRVLQKKGYLETSVLIKSEFLDSVQKEWFHKTYEIEKREDFRIGFSPNILPGDARKLGEKENYVMCRLSLRKTHYLRFYFSKAWSQIITSTTKGQGCIGQTFAIKQAWVVQRRRGSITLPCKAIYRWENGKELLINFPSWLPLVGNTRKSGGFNIWISHSSVPGKQISKGFLIPKGKSSSHYRCSRKEPWGFYGIMKDASDSGAMPEKSGIVEVMVAFTPEAIFS